MKTLPQEWTRKGYVSRIIQRQKDVVLIQLGKAECFEVCVVRRHQGRTLPDGGTIEPGEYLPSDEEFGRLGWYYPNRDRALAKFSEVLAELDKPKKGAKT
jgi:hypothetical protein